MLNMLLDTVYVSPRAFDKHFIFHTTNEEGTYGFAELKSKNCLRELHAGLTAPWLEALSKFLFAIYTATFDEEFGRLTALPNVQFATYCLDKDKARDSALAESYQEFFEVYTAKPISVMQEDLVENDEEAEDVAGEVEDDRRQTWARALRRKANIRFSALRDSTKQIEKDADLYKPVCGMKLQEVYNFEGKRFEKPVGTDNPDTKAGYRLLFLNADCFNFSHQTGRDDLHKVPVPMCEELSHALTWLAKQQDDKTIILACDGRSKQIRSAMQDWLTSNVADAGHAADVWVTYESCPADLRTPGRKIAFASNTREMLFLILPVERRYLKTQSRTFGTAAGETTTHDTTYTGVPRRPLSSLPRLSIQQKADMIGQPIPEVHGKSIQAEASKGHPLFWQEFKGISFLSAIFNELSVTSVFDLSPGCGTAAIACANNGIGYHGVCQNEKQLRWISGLLDMAILAVEVGQKGKNVDAEYIARIKNYFGTTVAEAKRMLVEQEVKTEDVEHVDSSDSDQ